MEDVVAMLAALSKLEASLNAVCDENRISSAVSLSMELLRDGAVGQLSDREVAVSIKRLKEGLSLSNHTVASPGSTLLSPDSSSFTLKASLAASVEQANDVWAAYAVKSQERKCLLDVMTAEPQRPGAYASVQEAICALSCKDRSCALTVIQAETRVAVVQYLVAVWTDLNVLQALIHKCAYFNDLLKSDSTFSKHEEYTYLPAVASLEEIVRCLVRCEVGVNGIGRRFPALLKSRCYAVLLQRVTDTRKKVVTVVKRLFRYSLQVIFIPPCSSGASLESTPVGVEIDDHFVNRLAILLQTRMRATPTATDIPCDGICYDDENDPLVEAFSWIEQFQIVRRPYLQMRALGPLLCLLDGDSPTSLLRDELARLCRALQVVTAALVFKRRVCWEVKCIRYHPSASTATAAAAPSCSSSSSSSSSSSTHLAEETDIVVGVVCFPSSSSVAAYSNNTTSRGPQKLQAAALHTEGEADGGFLSTFVGVLPVAPLPLSWDEQWPSHVHNHQRLLSAILAAFSVIREAVVAETFPDGVVTPDDKLGDQSDDFNLSLFASGSPTGLLEHISLAFFPWLLDAVFKIVLPELVPAHVPWLSLVTRCVTEPTAEALRRLQQMHYRLTSADNPSPLMAAGFLRPCEVFSAGLVSSFVNRLRGRVLDQTRALVTDCSFELWEGTSSILTPAASGSGFGTFVVSTTGTEQPTAGPSTLEQRGGIPCSERDAGSSDIVAFKSTSDSAFFKESPSVRVSACAATLVGLLYRCVWEALELLKSFCGRDGEDEGVQAGAFGVVRDSVELFGALMSSFWRRDLSIVPQLAFLFLNDCLYISHHLHVLQSHLHMAQLARSDVVYRRVLTSVNFLDVGETLLTAGRRCVRQQINRQCAAMVLALRNNTPDGDNVDTSADGDSLPNPSATSEDDGPCVVRIRFDDDNDSRSDGAGAFQTGGGQMPDKDGASELGTKIDRHGVDAVSLVSSVSHKSLSQDSKRLQRIPPGFGLTLGVELKDRCNVIEAVVAGAMHTLLLLHKGLSNVLPCKSVSKVVASLADIPAHAIVDSIVSRVDISLTAAPRLVRIIDLLLESPIMALVVDTREPTHASCSSSSLSSSSSSQPDPPTYVGPLRLSVPALPRLIALRSLIHPDQSLAGIAEMYACGALACFRSVELCHLVGASYEDSPKRDALLHLLSTCRGRGPSSRTLVL